MTQKNHTVHLPPIFTMIELYIQQYTNLFINQNEMLCFESQIDHKSIEQGNYKIYSYFIN